MAVKAAQRPNLFYSGIGHTIFLVGSGMTAERPADFITMYFERPGSGLQAIAVLLLDIDVDRLHVRARRDWHSIAGPEDARVLETMLVRSRGRCTPKGRQRDPFRIGGCTFKLDSP